MPYVMCGKISVLYNMVFMHRGNTYFNLFKTPIFSDHLFATFSVCFSQLKVKFQICFHQFPCIVSYLLSNFQIISELNLPVRSIFLLI